MPPKKAYLPHRFHLHALFHPQCSSLKKLAPLIIEHQPHRTSLFCVDVLKVVVISKVSVECFQIYLNNKCGHTYYFYSKTN